MNELDERKVDRKVLEEIRIRAVKRVEAGESPEVVIKAFGFARARKYEWIVKYREGGRGALRRKKAPGEFRNLQARNWNQYFDLLLEKTLDF